MALTISVSNWNGRFRPVPGNPNRRRAHAAAARLPGCVSRRHHVADGVERVSEFRRSQKTFRTAPSGSFSGHEFEHAPWTGCALWDLIQPAFMFMVGVALPWSVANRQARGENFGRMFGHARLARAVAGGAGGVSHFGIEPADGVDIHERARADRTGLHVPVPALFAKPRTQWLAAFGILFAYWLAFALHPVAPPASIGKASACRTTGRIMTGFAAHWEKNLNFAATFDLWFLNLFPARSAVHIQCGRLPDAQLHPVPGHDDLWDDRRPLAAERRGAE